MVILIHSFVKELFMHAAVQVDSVFIIPKRLKVSVWKGSLVGSGGTPPTDATPVNGV